MPWNQVHSELWLRSHSFRAKPNTQQRKSKIDSSFIPKGYCWKFHRGLHCPGCYFKHLIRVKGQSQAFPLSGALPTPVKVERLAYYLEGYNEQLYEELISGFLHGLRLHFHEPQIGHVSTNLLPAAQHPEIVDSKQAKEVLAGRVLGPFKHPPFDNFRVSPLGVIPKKQPDEYRMIHRSSLFSTWWLSQWFHSFWVLFSPLCFRWWCGTDLFTYGPSKFMQSCEQLSTAMEWVARNKLDIPYIIHILDYFLIAAESPSKCRTSLQNFLHFCEDLGVPMAPEKTEGPTKVLSFAGIELDCNRQEATLPTEKVAKCFSAIGHLQSKKKVTLKELQSIIGLLNFACSVIIPGRHLVLRVEKQASAFLHW